MTKEAQDLLYEEVSKARTIIKDVFFNLHEELKNEEDYLFHNAQRVYDDIGQLLAAIILKLNDEEKQDG